MFSCVGVYSICLLNGTNHAGPQAVQALSPVRFPGSWGYTFEPRFADIRLIRTLRYYGRLSLSMDKALTF